MTSSDIDTIAIAAADDWRRHPAVISGTDRESMEFAARFLRDLKNEYGDENGTRIAARVIEIVKRQQQSEIERN